MTNPGTLLPTTVIGSHALPSWLCHARDAMARGEFGPADIEETLRDATRIALDDQLSAGVDIVSDGEMRRVNFIIGFYGKLEGLETLPAPRQVGVPHWDTETPFLATHKLKAPEGLGIVEDFAAARTMTRHPMKATCPGPLTLSIPIRLGKAYKSQDTLVADLIRIVNAELKGLVAAGADFIQIDEPNYAMSASADPKYLVDVFNAAVQGVKAKVALHVCFGNLNGRAFAAPRSYERLFPHILKAKCSQLVFEYASREMSEIDLFARYGADKELGLGVIDVKAFRPESPADVAARIRKALQHLEPDKVYVNPDCGFWATPRWACRRKLQAMVDGTRLVREELAGAA
jgi:5-methyltetrahydropteroyltriglutamate--homocysteine methyltransferase